MKFKYTELLPSYLSGPNIMRHGRIIDDSTTEIYDKAYLLEQWSTLQERPILVQKIQEHGNAADVKIYCNSRYSLKRITITGDYEASVDFSEDDVVTSYTFNLRILKSALSGDTLEFAEATGIINPNLIITMEDYDEHTIVKAYPENDSIENTVYDHDPFLDIIGGLLTVKRRTYVAYENTMENVGNTCPAFFGKVLDDGIISECTEDDYYYLQRILYFIEKNGTEDLAKTMLKVVYELDCDVINYNQDICKMDVHDMDEKYMADNTSQDANTVVYRIVPVFYSNISHPEEEELNQFIKPYLPVTRKVITTWKENVLITFEGIQEIYCETGSFTIRVTDEEGEPIAGLPLELNYGAPTELVYADSNGEYLFEFGYPTGGGGALTVISQETDAYRSASNSCTYNVRKKTKTLNYLTLDSEVTREGVLTVSASVNTEGSGQVSTNANGTITYSENNVVIDEVDVVNGVAEEFTTNLSSGTHTISVHADLTYTGCTSGTTSINDTITAIVPVERTVVLEPIVMAATNDEITVDVNIWNGGQTAFLRLDGTITMSINDGTSTTLLDTQTLVDEDGVTLSSPSGSTFQDGNYTLLFELNATNPPAGYYYDNPITATESITISSMTSIDCTTTDAWTRNSGRITTTALLDNDGYITCVREGNNEYYTVCNDLVLQKGMTIEVDFYMKNSGTHGYGLEYMISNSPTRFFIYNGQLQEKHNGESDFTQNVASIPVNTLTTITMEIDNNGYITLTDSSGSHTSNTAFTDTQLALMQFSWKHWGTDNSFSVRRLQYTGGTGVTQTFEWGDTLTNWKSTSGTTYLPSLATQSGLTGIKAPQGINNMSFHMSYLDVPLRLDTVTVVSCEVYIAHANYNKFGIVSVDNTYMVDHQYNSAGMIQEYHSRFENLNGDSASISGIVTGAWVHASFIIDGQRNVTCIIEGVNNTTPSSTVTINTYDANNDTKNNRVYFGMHSAYPRYPSILVRCIRIVQFPTQSE